MKKTLRTILIMALSVAILLASVSMVFGLPQDAHIHDFNELLDFCNNLKTNDEYNVYLESNGDMHVTETLLIDVPCKLHFYGSQLVTPAIRLFYLDSDNIELYFHNLWIFDDSDLGYGYQFMDDGQAFYINGSNCIIDGAKMYRCGSMNYHGTVGGSGTDDFVNAWYSWNGGAIYINGWDNQILNCEFKYCNAQDDGGAICIYYDDQLIQGCTFNGCSADDDGGAIYCCVGVDDVVINKCTFIDCTCKDNTVGNNVYGRDNTIVAGVPQDQWTDELFYRCQFQTSYTASMFSNGSIIIIAAVAVVAAAVIVFFVKKKKAVAQN